MYPNSYHTFPDVSTGDVITAAHENVQSEALSEIEQTLGLTPAGAHPTVAAALASKLENYYAVDTSSTDDYAITVSPAPSAYTTGMLLRFKASTANVGPATLNVNSLGAKAIKKLNSQDLQDGDIQVGQIVEVVYDGTSFQLLSTPNAAVNNPMTALGDLISGGTNGAPVRTAGNTSSTKKFLTETGDGTNAAAPGWNTIAVSDVPTLDHTKISDFDAQVRTSRLDQMAAPTAAVSMNGQRLADLAAPTAGTDAVNAATVQKATTIYAVDSGAADAYVVTLSPAPATPLSAGMIVAFKAANANTGASTLNVNGDGAKPIRKQQNQALAAGDIKADQVVEVAYDGTNFQLLSPPSKDLSNPMSGLGDLIYGNTGGTPLALSGNTAATRKFLTEQGDGTNPAGPQWNTISVNDVPTLDHNKISDFDAQVRTSRLDQMAAPAVDLSMASHKITSVTDPTAAQDAATKSYVDASISASNPMTALGDTVYGGSGGTETRLAGNTTTTRKFLTETGDGTNAAAPAWNTIDAADVPTIDHTKISDFDTQVRTSRLDQMAAPTAPVSANSQKITSLADPTVAQDAATKNYVDGAVSGSNPMTTLGDTIYGGTGGAETRLAGNTTTTRKFLSGTGDGTNAAAPAWNALAASDIPTLDHTKISDFDAQVRTSRLDQMAAPTAPVSMNNQRITSLADPTAQTDAATAQVVQKGSLIYAADTGSANAYAVSLSPAPTAYTTGMTVVFKAANANTGTSTLNVNSLGAKNIMRNTPSGLVNLIDKDIRVSQTVTVVYDGTQFQMVSASATASAPPPGAVSNLIIKNTSAAPNSKVDVNADLIVVADTAGATIALTSVAVTADITLSGAGGLDTGSEAASTWYYIWAIYDGTNKKALLSTSSTSPTMPSGYTYKRLVGAVRNDGSSNFLQFYQYDGSVHYLAKKNVLGAGGATSWTSISLSSFVPPNAPAVRILMRADAATGQSGMPEGTCFVGVNNADAVVIGTYVNDLNNNSFDNDLTALLPQPTAQTVYYYHNNSNGALDMEVIGFEVNL